MKQMSQVKILPIDSLEPAETLDDKIDEKQRLKTGFLRFKMRRRKKSFKKPNKKLLYRITAFIHLIKGKKGRCMSPRSYD
jgi:hypothetical protein